MFSNHLIVGFLGILALCAAILTGKAYAAEEAPSIVWHDAVDIGIEGIGWTDTKTPYDRLSGRAEGVVTGAVWGLSLNSAGLCVRFTTDASSVRARWTLRQSGLSMDHMPSTGDSGIDLYAKVDGVWLYAGTARIKGGTRDQEYTLASGIP
ncbi:MAG: hypothetical protein GY851_18495, partial [bacterium]|nr:hypothetical protein [bacterium]